jgi:hypothetical protein
MNMIQRQHVAPRPASGCVRDYAGVVHLRAANLYDVVCCGITVPFNVDAVVIGGTTVCTCLECLTYVPTKGVSNEGQW